jgi:hypothetical protein
VLKSCATYLVIGLIMRKKIFFNCLFLFILCILNISISGQDKSTNNEGIKTSSYWLNLGFGASYFGPTFKAGLSYSYNNNIFSFRYLKADEFHWGSYGGGDYFDNNSALRFNEIGILYGTCQKAKSVFMNLSGGVGYIKGRDHKANRDGISYNVINISTICLPLEASVRVELTNFFSIGFSGFGNLNNRKSFAGWLIEANIGSFN